jgi:hypothetical protein
MFNMLDDLEIRKTQALSAFGACVFAQVTRRVGDAKA